MYQISKYLIIGLTWLHKKAARLCVTVIGWIWRTQARIPMAWRFAIGDLGIALGGIAAALIFPTRYISWNGFELDQVRTLEVAGLLTTGKMIAIYGALCATIALVAAGFSNVRKPFVHWLHKIVWAAHAILWVWAMRWLFMAPSALNAADYKLFGKELLHEAWLWPLFLGSALTIWPLIVLVGILTISAHRFYNCLSAEPNAVDIALGLVPAEPTKKRGLITTDALIENLRTGGDDPRMRSSMYWALFIFLAVIVGPFIIFGCGIEEYGIVQGSGEPEVQMVQIKKPKPKKKQKKLLVDPWSPYILERMNIDDVKTLEELQEQTMDTYVADRTSKGKLGKGGKGKGGWPKGMEGAKVRFIRLKYNGGDWDKEMGKSGDYNMLIKFSQMTGLPVAPESEYREIDRMARFAKHRAPPFVFISGSGNINISTREAKILRDYCEDGGMLFIDNGGGYFGRSVRSMLSKVFPGKALIDIPNDDPIYQTPYVFPDGAPRFWHHDGNRALGIRHEGRLVVFYHPGDMQDAWKEGHSGVTAEVADQAYKLGVNVIYYAFNQYYRRHYEQDGEEE